MCMCTVEGAGGGACGADTGGHGRDDGDVDEPDADADAAESVDCGEPPRRPWSFSWPCGGRGQCCDRSRYRCASGVSSASASS